jgi:hypothetical protein
MPLRPNPDQQKFELSFENVNIFTDNGGSLYSSETLTSLVQKYLRREIRGGLINPVRKCFFFSESSSPL